VRCLEIAPLPVGRIDEVGANFCDDAFRAMVGHIVVRHGDDGQYQVDVVGPLSTLTGDRYPEVGESDGSGRPFSSESTPVPCPFPVECVRAAAGVKEVMTSPLRFHGIALWLAFGQIGRRRDVLCSIRPPTSCSP
jgi:hypothetical protein